MGPLVLIGVPALFWRVFPFKNKGQLGSRYIIIYICIHLVVKGSMAIATPKRWRFVRGHDKPRLTGVASHRSFPGGIYIYIYSIHVGMYIHIYTFTGTLWDLWQTVEKSHIELNGWFTAFGSEISVHGATVIQNQFFRTIWATKKNLLLSIESWLFNDGILISWFIQ